MPAEPPDNASSKPEISRDGKRYTLVLLVISLILAGIEVRAGLGQFLTMRALNSVSENNGFKDVSFAEVEGMLVGFPSKSPVEKRALENVHHYQWYSLLRPLTGSKSPELYVTSNHKDPAGAVSFYTSVEDFVPLAHDIPAPDFSAESYPPQRSSSDANPAGDVTEGKDSEEDKQ